MSGDYSRVAYDPRQNYTTVLLQQGRPLTDRDWNEFALGSARRNQVTTLDVHGATYISAVSPGAFRITVAASGELLIARGRLYLNGLLVENHGSDPLKWDDTLATQVGSEPVRYTQQPYLPDLKPMPATGGPYLIYLEAWQREVTQFTDSGLVETVLGIDTTTRLQTVWQVKFIDVGANITCMSDLGGNAKWRVATDRSAGRLSIETAPFQPTDADPLLVPPSSGYRGLENQLYRVEIHDGGPLGTATFKWSRENSSIQARVTKIIDGGHIAVDSIGKDDLLRFSNGDWIEVIDDPLELAGSAGKMTRIKIDGGVDERTRTLAIDPELPVNAFPVDAQGRPHPARHMRIRRWDQKNKVFTSTGTLVTDLSEPGSKGVIPAQGTAIHLEDGIAATFAIDPMAPSPSFRTGDYWTFAARADTASVESLKSSPPRGIHRHYARLAVHKPGAALTDCRPALASLPELAARLSSIETRVGRLDSAISELNSKLNSLDQKFNDLKDAVNSVKTKVTAIESKLTGADGLPARLDRAETKINETNTRLDSADTKIGEAITRIGAVEKVAMVPSFNETSTVDVNPKNGAPNTPVIIIGRNFKIGSLVVKFGSAAVTTFTRRTETLIELKVPGNLPPGPVALTLSNNFGEVVSAQQFDVLR